MMKFSTKARYGLRLMVELARESEKQKLVCLGKIGKLTGLSENYLAQLAMSLKNNGILIGISGKNGGYQLAKPADQIKISEIVKAVGGPICLVDCVNHPDICLNSSFCETRLLWVILSGNMFETLDKYSLEDLINRNRLDKVKKENAHLALLDSDKFLAENSKDNS